MSSRCDAVRPQLTVISVRAACTGSCGGRSLGSVCEVDGVNTAERVGCRTVLRSDSLMQLLLALCHPEMQQL